MLQLKSIDQDTYFLFKNLVQKDYLNHFVLAGGTALALQLGHRISIDLDLFTIREFDSNHLLEQLNADFKVNQASAAKNTLNMFIDYKDQRIKVEFIRHNYPVIDDFIEEDGIRLYSIKDIAAMKLNAIANRGSKKDFYDLYALLSRYSLVDLVNFFKNKYQVNNAFTVIKSLTYFADAELEPDPKSIAPLNWDDVKGKIKLEVHKCF